MNRNENGYVQVGDVEVWPYYYDLMPEGWWQALAQDASLAMAARDELHERFLDVLDSDSVLIMCDAYTDESHTELGFIDFECRHNGLPGGLYVIRVNGFRAPDFAHEYNPPLTAFAGVHPFFDALIAWQEQHPDEKQAAADAWLPATVTYIGDQINDLYDEEGQPLSPYPLSGPIDFTEPNDEHPYWELFYENTLDDSRLTVRFRRGVPPEAQVRDVPPDELEFIASLHWSLHDALEPWLNKPVSTAQAESDAA